MITPIRTNSPNHWDRRFMALAEHVAQWSKDPHHKVGAVVVDGDNLVRGMGFNGFPPGVSDHPNRYLNTSLKHELIIHAEPNALRNCFGSVRGDTIYVWPFPPCVRCAGEIISAGISKVVCPSTLGLSDEIIVRYGESFYLARGMYQEACVEVMEMG